MSSLLWQREQRAQSERGWVAPGNFFDWRERSTSFGVSPFDATAFAVVTFVLLAVTAAASLLPARRAARADPMAALRAE